MAERYYDCEKCSDKNCSICPNCGKNPKMRAPTDPYRASVKKGYYSSSIIPVYDENGNFLKYTYNKPGE